MTDYIGKLSKTKIKELCLKCLEDNGFHPTDINVGNGYFLFDFGKNSVVHFKIKEIPYWLFGLWILDDKEKKEYTIQFFGEKEDWIDKFKPSRTSISSSKNDGDKVHYRVPFRVTNENKCKYFDVDFAVWTQMDELQRLKKNRRIAEYGLSDTNRSFLKWLWKEIWFYDIEKPLTDFYEAKIQGILYKLCLRYLGFKYRKYIKIRPIVDMSDPGYYRHPRYECGVEYLPDVPNDKVKEIWYELEDSKISSFIRKNSNFGQYSDSEAKRSFYYPEYYEKKDAERKAKYNKN